MECFRHIFQTVNRFSTMETYIVLQAMGEVADKAESLQNLFNCTVPLISSVSVGLDCNYTAKPKYFHYFQPSLSSHRSVFCNTF